MLDPWLVGVIGLAAVIALIVAVAKMVDLWRRRRRERAALPGVITGALLAEPRLVDSMVVAKVRIPF